jgi:hypothetical protein
MQWRGHMGEMWETRNECRILFRGKCPLGRPRRKWVGKITIYIKIYFVMLRYR